MQPFRSAKLLLCTLLAASAQLHASAQQVDLRVGGEAGAANWRERYAVSASGNGAARLVDDPRGRTGKVFELTLPAAGRQNAAPRIELTPLREARGAGLRWYAMSVMLPDGWTPPAAPLTVAQIDLDRPGAGLKPPLALRIEGRQLWLELHSSQRRGMPAQGGSMRAALLDDVAPRQWYCFIVKADWQAALGQGSLSVWLDDTLMYRASRNNNAYPAHAYVPRVGLSPDGPMAGGRKLYTDFIWLGGDAATHKQMFDRTPCGRRR